MSDFHYIAVLTYGTDIQNGHSCFRLGHGAGAEVLLTLFGSHAQEMTSPKASYRYVHLDAKKPVRTHRYYLILRVTSEEKAQIEAICRKQGSFTWVYLWEDSRWLQFPCAPEAFYTDPSSYGSAYPKFPPSAAPFVTPAEATGKTTEAEANKGITLTKSGDWWWIGGDTYPYREILKSAGAKWSKTRHEWYFKGRELPRAIQDLATAHPKIAVPIDTSESSSPLPQPEEIVTSNGTAFAVVKHELPAHTFDPPDPLPAKAMTVTPGLSVSVPSPEYDKVQFAIDHLKDVPALVAPQAVVSGGKSDAASIAQEYVGELTGSITGNVHCFGYAVDRGVCIYLNFGGPRTAVEAIRAKLSLGQIVTCVPWNNPSVELTAGEGNTGMYTSFMQNIPEARYTSVILLHEQITQPNYGGQSRTAILRTSEAQGIAKLQDHIQRLVHVPVFDSWAAYLWEAGALADLLSQPKRAGGIDLWSVELDADAWTRLICGGLEKGLIKLP